MNIRTQLHIAFLFLFVSCTPQKGTVETQALSKKVFESLRDDDFEGIKEIIPNKSGYEKILSLQGKSAGVNVDKQFAAFLIQCESDFRSVRGAMLDWSNTEYQNTNELTSKEENVANAVITTKFKQGETIRKITFNASKIGGRWFYYSGLQLTQKPDTESSAQVETNK